MQANPQVFLSYCRSDGAKFAAALRDKLEKEHPEIKLWQDVISERAGRDWWLQITEALDHVEYMVLVLTPDAMQSVTVRKEWRYARQQGVCVFPVQGSSHLEFSVLPRWIRDLHIDDIGYDEQHNRFPSGGQWQKFINQLNSPCDTPRVPFMAEDLPPDFVARPLEFEKLADLLRDDKREEPVAITAALHGAGGFGKTTLARALCHDERIQEVFDDGMLWVTLGENPGDLTSKVVDLVEVLSGERPGFQDVEAASSRLSELLADRDILVVIDDVWNAAHAQPFLNGGKRCARLITTRNQRTLPPNSHPVSVDAMQQSEALQLLATGLGAGQEHLGSLRSLATRLGEWPLLLRLANAVLRERVRFRNQPIDAALDYAQKALDKRGLTAFDIRNPSVREQAVAKTVGVSLELLSEHERFRFVELAIFPEDTNIPLATVAQLWRATGGLDNFDAEDLCSRLHSLSLLLDCDLTKREIRLHDVMRKFLNSQLHDAASVHRRLVDAWGDPHRLSDTYAWYYLPYHLAHSNRLEYLRQLLLDYEWIQAALGKTDITLLISHYNYLANQDSACASVQGTLQLCAHILGDRDQQTQLSSQFLGRLLNNSDPSVNTLVNQAVLDRHAVRLRPLKPTLVPAGGPLRFTLEGHRAPVVAVAITPDGKRAISTSADKTLKIWNLCTARLLRTLEGHTDEIDGLALTPDGTRVISSSSDGTIKVWEIETGNLIFSVRAHTESMWALALTADGTRVMACCDDCTIKVWDLKTAKLLRRLHDPRTRDLGPYYAHRPMTVAVTPDGTRVVSISDDYLVHVWELNSGKLLHSLFHSRFARDEFEEPVKPKYRPSIMTLAITLDGTRVLSTSNDSMLNIWDLKSGKLIHSLLQNEQVAVLALTPDGTHVVSGCDSDIGSFDDDDYTVKLWNLNTGNLVHCLRGHSDWATALAVTPDGGHAVSAARDLTIRVWDLKSGELIHTFQGHSDSVNSLAITPDATHLISASGDHTLKLWALKSAKFPSTSQAHSGSVTTLAMLPNGVHVISASDDKTLKLWEVESGRELQTFYGHTGSIVSVAITPDGAHAVSASSDHTLKIWDLSAATLLHSLLGHKEEVTGVAVTPDGKHVISASHDNTLKVWELKTGTLVHSFAQSDYDLEGPLAITRDGNYVVCGRRSNSVEVFALHSPIEQFPPKLLHALPEHHSPINTFAITPDGAYVVSGSWGMTICEVQSGKLLNKSQDEYESVCALAITPDGTYVLSGSYHGLVKVWNLGTGQLFQSLEGHRSDVSALAIMPNGTFAVSASNDCTVKIWNIRHPKLLATFSADAALRSLVAPNTRTIIAGDVLGQVHFLRLEHPE